MQRFRKVLVLIAAALLSTVVFLCASFWIMSQTVGRPLSIKTWLSRSEAYTNMVSVVAQSSDATSTGSTLPIKDPEIIAAGRKAFSEPVLKTGADKAIDQVFDWLDGRAKPLDVNVDFTGPRANFAASVGAVVTNRLAALPACGQAASPLTFDVFKVDCLPAGIIPVNEGAKITNDLIADRGFLGGGVVTNSTLNLQNQSSLVLRQAPAVYRAGRILPLLLAVLATALLLIIIFGSTERRNGFKRAVRTLFATSVIMVLSLAATPLISRSIVPANPTNDKLFVEKIVHPIIHQIEQSLIYTQLIAIGVVGGLWLIGFLVLKLWKSAPEVRQ